MEGSGSGPPGECAAGAHGVRSARRVLRAEGAATHVVGRTGGPDAQGPSPVPGRKALELTAVGPSPCTPPLCPNKGLSRPGDPVFPHFWVFFF